MKNIKYKELTLMQLAKVVQETYGTPERPEVLKNVPAAKVSPYNVRMFLAEEELEELEELFRIFDVDGDNDVNFEELRIGFREMKVGMNDSHILHLAREMDKNSNGVMDFEEFAALMFRVKIKLAQGATVIRKGLFFDWVDTKPIRAFTEHQLEGRVGTTVGAVRAAIWRFFNDPFSSKASLVMNMIIMLMIVASCMFFFLESLPDIRTNAQVITNFETAEVVFVICFSIEFVLRLCCCPSLPLFCLSFLNWVDLAAILPFYIELFTSGNDIGTGDQQDVVKGIRLIRVVRVLKIARYVRSIQVFANTMQNSIAPLAMAFFVVMVGMVAFSSAMYYCERGDFDVVEQQWVVMANATTGQLRKSGFQSVWSSTWYTFSTATTVGYGDVVPFSSAGKTVGVMTAIFGILVLAIPISIISTNFRQEYDFMQARLALEQEQLRNAAKTNHDPDFASKELQSNLYLRAAVSKTRRFAIDLASNGEELPGAHLFTTAIYKTCRASQKGLFATFKYQERENRHLLFQSTRELANEYLDRRVIDWDTHSA